MEALHEGESERSLAQETYEVILERLVSNSFSPGARLTVDQLARELEVSQTPIRQALVTLESEGLVTRHKYSGYRVSPLLEKKEFEDLFSVRNLLEPEAARLAARRGNQELFRRLDSLQEKMLQAANQDGSVPYALFARLDSALHASIAQASENAPLMDSIERLHSQVHIFRLSHGEGMAEDATKEHAEVIAAIQTGDGDRARKAMKRHLRMAKHRFKDSF